MITNDNLPGSAISAAGFGDYEKYPDLAIKAAVLLQAIAKNHALPDGNKRTVLLYTIVFGLDGCRWVLQPGDDPEGAETAQRVKSAASGSISHEALTGWIGEHLIPWLFD